MNAKIFDMGEGDLVQQFIDSMIIDYEKWHDGIGYDIDLIPRMTFDEQAQVEAHLLARGVQDWRDLEALDAIGTPKAIEAILRTRERGSTELRVQAQRYGPQPSDDEKDDAIVEALEKADLGEGLSRALDLAAEHDSPRVRAALFRVARTKTGIGPYHAVATLFMHFGLTDSQYDDTHREFYLRFSGPLGAERDAAFRELCARLGVDPESACE